MDDAKLQAKWRSMVEYGNGGFWKKLTLEELQQFIDAKVDLNAHWEARI